MVGFEGNYGYSRYTRYLHPLREHRPNPRGVQQNASEYTLGYVVHAKKQFFGMHPFCSAAGTVHLSSAHTPAAARPCPIRPRAAYYYSVGAETTVLSPHFGLRAQFRQVFFKAPDFEPNYLTIQQHTSTYEPGFGFFLRF